MTETIRCYALRRVNPFQGVLQAIETDYGRTYSTNGRDWQLQIPAQKNKHWVSVYHPGKKQPYCRYGLLNQTTGLIKFPLVPHLQQEILKEKSTHLINLIKSKVPELPFNLQDCYEYWLLNKTDLRPLALLATSVDKPETGANCSKTWRASITVTQSNISPPDIELLEKRVKEHSGGQQACWIKREENGSGVDVISGKNYTSELFPPYLIGQNWDDPVDQACVSDYIDWISPALLTLQNLDINHREQREKKLHLQASVVLQHYRLYPQVANEKLIKAALVQSRLQQVNPDI